MRRLARLCCVVHSLLLGTDHQLHCRDSYLVYGGRREDFGGCRGVEEPLCLYSGTLTKENTTDQVPS